MSLEEAHVAECLLPGLEVSSRKEHTRLEFDNVKKVQVVADSLSQTDVGLGSSSPISSERRKEEGPLFLVCCWLWKESRIPHHPLLRRKVELRKNLSQKQELWLAL
ncbi:unnamed protein product [Lupinus luteus]|uniref:Uncharacterized protein n=1 Tax=Lupinus luteus TaxID=3873 RepID=A0AAV1YLQ6_LUPLU